MLFKLVNYITPFYLLNPGFSGHINHRELVNNFKNKYISGANVINQGFDDFLYSFYAK